MSRGALGLSNVSGHDMLLLFTFILPLDGQWAGALGLKTKASILPSYKGITARQKASGRSSFKGR